MMNSLPLCFLFLLYVAPTEAVEYTHSLVLGDGSFNVSWTYKSATDKFQFLIRAKATGWIGFGVTKLEFEGDEDGVLWSKTGMDSFDIVVGGVYDNGTNYYNDYYTEYGYNNFPKRDEQQDWLQTSFKEEDGFTTLKYQRKRNTSDKMDNVIKEGNMFLVWAYHLRSDEFKNLSHKHTASGFSPRLQLIPEPRRRPVLFVHPTTTPDVRSRATNTAIGSRFSLVPFAGVVLLLKFLT